MGNARSFALQIDRELDAAIEEEKEKVEAIALEALTRIVLRTPVDTGRARNNWFTNIGPSGSDKTEIVDPSGSEAISRGSVTIEGYSLSEGWPMISIFNNLPYIERLEDGYSKQAASGMVAVTVAELQAAL